MARPPPRVHRDVEILVHIAAPSNAADDARYRQLAQAYLAFRPDSRTGISSPRDRRHGLDARDTLAAEQRAPPGSAGSQAAPVGLVPESQELSFDGATGNHGSFRARDDGPGALGSPAPSLAPAPMPPPPVPASSWHTPPSHISDSYPLPDARLVASSRAAALEQCFLPFAPQEADDAQSPPPQRPGGGAAAEARAAGLPGGVQVPSSIPVPDSQGRPGNGSGSGTTNAAAAAEILVPVTPSLPGGAPQRKRKAFEAYDQSVIERTRLSSSISSSSSSHATHVSDSFPHRAESAPPVPKRPRPRPSPPPLVRSTSDVGPAVPLIPLPPPEPAGGRAPPQQAADHALEIRSPSPPPGTAALAPADLVSAKLAQLTHDLSSRFRPRLARSPPEPLERGYWLADCAAWPRAARAEAWRFLADYVRSGLAGWGVWCRRDEAPHAWIRLYCWGHVVEHTYLLLYLASHRLLKKTGAKWFDGGGEVVLEVMPYEEQRVEMSKQTEE
ncbi:hypothetical protein ESCO_006102 [Escovopsis weberi]|uniref:Uncharacterized protein n=1 Tax=Escovopsis weberi TaxID=150374 RepID=A0A0M8N581_ESCWE|nr:hypothetical protein ESCO_006102 [Escovopsis weberi]